jgi:hypothetical protein
MSLKCESCPRRCRCWEASPDARLALCMRSSVAVLDELLRTLFPSFSKTIFARVYSKP